MNTYVASCGHAFATIVNRGSCGVATPYLGSPTHNPQPTRPITVRKNVNCKAMTVDLLGKGGLPAPRRVRCLPIPVRRLDHEC